MCGWKFSTRPACRITWKFWLTNVPFGGMSMLRAPPAMLLERGEHLAILRLLAFRIEVDAELDLIGDLFTDRVIVDLEDDLRSGQHQLAAVRRA